MIATDASDLAVGAVFLIKKGNLEKPVIYVSRKLQPAEKNYITEFWNRRYIALQKNKLDPK